MVVYMTKYSTNALELYPYFVFLTVAFHLFLHSA